MQNEYDVSGPGPGDAQAREAVSVPAILLMVVGILTVLSALAGFAQMAMGGTQLPPELANNPDMAEFLPWLQRAQGFGAIGNILSLALGGFTFFGGLKMKNLESHGLAMGAAIVACIPCFGSCCCMGIPVGIWALVVLNKPEVKSAFR